MQGKPTQRRTPSRSFGLRAQLGFGSEGELFSLQSSWAGGGARGGRPASCAFYGFPPYSAYLSSSTSTPILTSPPPFGRCSSSHGVGLELHYRTPKARRFVAAAVSCRDATAVAEWYRCALDTGDRWVLPLGAFRSRAQAAPFSIPLISPPTWLGWVCS